MRESVSLAEHTSFHIGGPAAFFIEVSSKACLAAALSAGRSCGLSILVLGGGTNLLISDEGFEGLAIKPRLEELEVASANGFVRVGAGVSSARLVEVAIEAGLCGLQFAAGLPGTVGGAIAGNAGCFGCTFGEQLSWADVVLPDGNIARVEPQWFDYQYRFSRALQTGAVVAEVGFELSAGDHVQLREEAAGNLALRRERHPRPDTRTAGSYFKNLPAPGPGQDRVAAGALLDQVGAKQMTVGDAAVFERHANIVVNSGSAAARDVLQLTQRMARRVRERFAVVLEPEVRFVGRRPSGLEIDAE